MVRSRLILTFLGVTAMVTLVIRVMLEAEFQGGFGDALISVLRFFTIWTNILLACVCLWLARGIAGDWTARQISLATAATLFIVFVGVVYHLLLSATHEPQGVQIYTNLMFHYLIPAGMLAAWLTLVPKGRLLFRSAIVWLSFPLAYLIYALVRGEVLGDYPYFFIDVATYGYQQVLLNAAGFTMVLLVLGTGLIGIDRLLARLQRAPAA